MAKAFPRQRSCRFRGRWPSRQFAAVSEVGRGRSPGGIAGVRALSGDNDLFRPGLAAGPPDARRLARAYGPLKGKAFGRASSYF